MSGRLLKALSPFGPLSPLNPRHPLNPLRSQVVEPRPPAGALDDSHRSLLAKLYGDTSSLDRVPFPNMEWWWNTIDFKAGKAAFSLLTNVQLFAMPVGDWVAQGTIALRLVAAGGRTWQAHTSGDLDPGDSCRFTAPGWDMRFEPNGGKGTYRVRVKDGDIDADFAIAFADAVHFNDPELPRGWYNNNPDGFIPYWASYRSRFGTPAGAITVSGQKYPIADGHARFDHQSLHWSARDVRSLSPGVLGEALITRPRWVWCHARLETPTPLNLTVYELTNGHTGTVLKRAGALCDDAGVLPGSRSKGALHVEKLTFKGAKPTGGRTPAPTVVDVSFEAGDHSYDLRFECATDQDWTVVYPIVGPVRYEAREAFFNVTGTVTGPRGVEPVTGTGTQEVLDMLSSVSLGR